MAVYFMQAGDAIKIGHAERPDILRMRYTSMNVHNPMPVRILGVRPDLPDISCEKALHKKLASSRIKGEWFRPDDAVMAEVALAHTVRGLLVRDGADRHNSLPLLHESPARTFIIDGWGSYLAFAKAIRADANRVRQVAQGCYTGEHDWLEPVVSKLVALEGAPSRAAIIDHAKRQQVITRSHYSNRGWDRVLVPPTPVARAA